MAGLADLLGPESTVFQMFVYNIVGSIVSALLGPYVLEASKLVNAAHQAGVLSPEQLAELVVRGHVGQADAQEQARLSGLPAESFDLLVKGTGLPPGPELLASALRRGIIGEGAAGDTGPSYLGGIAQSNMQTSWADALLKMTTSPASPSDAVLAGIRNVIDNGTARQKFVSSGGDPDDFDLLFGITGEGPSPVEAGVLANRRIIPWSGGGANAVSFQQAVAESRFKDKWTAAYQALSTYRPPPRTVTAMFREGSIDQATAIQYLQDYGVPQAAIPAYLKTTNGGATAKAKELTESMIVTAYKEGAANRATSLSMLKDAGYADAEGTFILDTADAENRLHVQSQVVAAVHKLYTSRRISQNEASQQLDTLHVLASQRDNLLMLWGLEIKQTQKELTAAEIGDAFKYGIIEEGDALDRLDKLGYPRDVATILLEIKVKGPIGG